MARGGLLHPTTDPHLEAASQAIPVSHEILAATEAWRAADQAMKLAMDEYPRVVVDLERWLPGARDRDRDEHGDHVRRVQESIAEVREAVLDSIDAEQVARTRLNALELERWHRVSAWRDAGEERARAATVARAAEPKKSAAPVARLRQAIARVGGSRT